MTEYHLTSRWRTAFPTELEEREAARFAGMTWEQYSLLVGTSKVARLCGEDNSKCAVIAHYRMTMLFDAVMLDLKRKNPER